MNTNHQEFFIAKSGVVLLDCPSSDDHLCTVLLRGAPQRLAAFMHGLTKTKVSAALVRAHSQNVHTPPLHAGDRKLRKLTYLLSTGFQDLKDDIRLYF
jgi:hypothetical protein